MPEPIGAERTTEAPPNLWERAASIGRNITYAATAPVALPMGRTASMIWTPLRSSRRNGQALAARRPAKSSFEFFIAAALPPPPPPLRRPRRTRLGDVHVK